MKKINILQVIVCIGCVLGCSKENPTPGKSWKDYIIGDWKYSALEVKSNTQGFSFTADLSFSLYECLKDNTYTYKTDGTIIKNEGREICFFEPTEIYGTWYMNAEQTKLTQRFDYTQALKEIGDTLLSLSGVSPILVNTFSIDNLNDNTLILKIDTTIGSGNLTSMGSSTHTFSRK